MAGLGVAAALAACLRPNDTVLGFDSAAIPGSVDVAGSGVAPAAGAGSSPPTRESTTPSAAAVSGAAGVPAAAGVGATRGGAGSGTAGVAAPSSGSAGAGVSPPAPLDADCDFNGIWIARQITVSDALGVPQSGNNWYYLELQQSGSSLEVSKHFDCGIEAVGSGTAIMARKTIESLLSHNVQTGRKGTVMKSGSRCDLELARFWSVRGGDELRLLPSGGRSSLESISEVAAANPLPTSSMTDGAVDTEADGKLGVAIQVSGPISGTRNSVQRDWNHWYSAPGFEITPSLDWTTDLQIRVDFDNEESVIDPTSGLLVTPSMPSTTAQHRLTLRFLGRDVSDPRSAAIVKASEIETCFAIQDALEAEALE